MTTFAPSAFILKNPGTYASMPEFEEDLPVVDPWTLHPGPGVLLRNNHQVPLTPQEKEEYLKRIRNTRVYDEGVAIETPLSSPRG